MTQSMNHNLGTSLRRLYSENQKLATGKRIQYPSDDPVALEATMRLGTMVSQLGQYQKNVRDAEAWLNLTESSFAQIGEGVHRARALSINAANGTLAEGDRADVAKEVAQIREDIFSIGNTRFGDRYIFGGTKTQSEPFINNGTHSYVGATGDQTISYEIGPGITLQVGVNGDEAILPVLDALSTLETALINNDTQGIDHALGRLDDAFGNLLRWRSEVGARMSRLELTEDRYAQDVLNVKALISDKEDVDYAETIMRLKEEESVYRAALATGARIIQPTLLDFLR